MSQEKFLLIKERTGMSNRILNLLGSLLYAKITQRKLIVDWSDEAYSQDRTNVFSRLFTLAQVDFITEIPNTNSVLPKIWQGNLHKSVEEVLTLHGVNKKERVVRSPLFWSRYRIDVARNYNASILVRWSYFAEIHKLRRYFKSEFSGLKKLDDKTILKNLIKKYLVLEPNIQRRVDIFKEKNFVGKMIIGVHIRYTDRKNSFTQYPGIIHSILKGNPDAMIFLATDSLPVQRFFKEQFIGKIILTDKWFPDETSATAQLHINPDCPDKLENGIQALVDMYLLASCDYLVCDQTSTFAYVVELLSDIPDLNIIDTSRHTFKRNFKKLVYWIERWL